MAPELLPLFSFVLVNFYLAGFWPDPVYKEAALLHGEACQSIRTDPSLCTQSFFPYTRCRWPRLGLTYIYFE
jgi:hypothetical protein